VRDLPTGTVSFLFTDIEGSTRLLQELGDDWASVVREHHRLMREAFAAAHGREVDTQGDAFFAVFGRARDAIDAAVACQRALAAHEWPRGAAVRARVGIHTGEPRLEEEGYLGLDVVRASRVCAAAHGGQIVITASARELVRGNEPEGVEVRDLGEHRLRDIDRPEHLFELSIADLDADHPALRTEPVSHSAPAPPLPDWRRQLDSALDLLDDRAGLDRGWEERLETALEQLGVDQSSEQGSSSVSWSPSRGIKVGATAIAAVLVLALIGVVALVVWLVQLVV
jgi:class 3 adenylate cyclase